MTREEFIGKLRSIYVGEENAIDEIISEYDSMINLNNQLVEECQRLDIEETRLTNIINELEEFFKYAYDNEIKPLNDRKISVWTICLDKLKELKEDNK